MNAQAALQDEHVSTTPIPGDREAVAGTYVTFDLCGQTLGAEVRYVREVLDQVQMARLPNTPHEIEGVVDIRGQTVPIIDMGSKLGLPRQEDGEETRIIVFELQHEGRVQPLGVLADKVRDVTQIMPEEVETPPEIVGSNWDANVLRGLARHADLLILLLNLDNIFEQHQFAASLDTAYL